MRSHEYLKAVGDADHAVIKFNHPERGVVRGELLHTGLYTSPRGFDYVTVRNPSAFVGLSNVISVELATIDGE